MYLWLWHWNPCLSNALLNLGFVYACEDSKTLGVCVCVQGWGLLYPCRLYLIYIGYEYTHLSPMGLYIITRQTDTHTYTFTHTAHSTKTQTTDHPAPIPFATHCRAHGSLIDWQVIWSNRCCDCVNRTSQRIVLLSSSGSVLRGWNTTPLCFPGHYRNR